ncbi:MAG: hypothetical protein E7234_09850 [Lachnospiraceae bacterium]|nr:hypothetical protein [Lachnospiraceae bacterium]
MLKMPYLARSDNRAILARENKIYGNPYQWFDTSYFKAQGIYTLSFDFFINWRKNCVADEIWVKRLTFEPERFLSLGCSEVLEEITEIDSKDCLRRLYKFSKAFDFIAKYMIIPDIPGECWRDFKNKVLSFDLSHTTKEQYASNSRQTISLLNANEIQEVIKRLRKEAKSIGAAGLIYATSSLESYLSSKPYFWPGDVDIVLTDKEGSYVYGIIEIKKHTKASKIPFHNQTIHNYLKKDNQKYASLDMLRKRLSCKFFMLFYSVEPEDRNFIVEEIEEETFNILSRKQYAMPLQHELQSFADEIKWRFFHGEQSSERDFF